MRGDIELPDQPHISEVCLDLLRHLITPDPDERFSAEQCMSHPWFQQVSEQDRPRAMAIMLPDLSFRANPNRPSRGQFVSAESARERNRADPRLREADGAALGSGAAARLREEDAAARQWASPIRRLPESLLGQLSSPAVPEGNPFER